MTDFRYPRNRSGRPAGVLAALLCLALSIALSGCPNPAAGTTLSAGPTGLSSRAGVDRIEVSWTDREGATAYDLYWAASPDTDLEDATKVAGATSPCMVTGLSAGTEYYFRVVASVDGEDTAPSEELSVDCGYTLGGPGPGGGYLFYDKGAYSDGWRYMECAPSDQSGGVVYGTPGSGSTNSAIGTGAENTDTIVGMLGSGAYAARICYDLSLGGYDDWFLPSNLEMLEMRGLYNAGIGGFAAGEYWSSYYTFTSLIGPAIFTPWYNKLSDGTNGFPWSDASTLQYRVRAARRF